MISENPRVPTGRPSAFYLGVFFTGSGTAINIVLLLLETLIAVRLLDPASYGTYVLLVVLANIGVVAIDFGCKTSVTQMISARTGDQKNAVAITALMFRLAAVIVVFAIVWLGRDTLLWLEPSRELALYIMFVPLLIAAPSLDELLTSILQGFQAYPQMAIAQIIRSVLRVAMSAAFLQIFHLGISGLLYSWILSFAVSIGYQTLVLPVPKHPLVDRKVLGEVLHFGLPIQGTRILWFIFGRANVLLIGALAGTASVAFYSVAARIPEALQRLSESYTAVYFPTISALLNGGNRREGAGIFRHSLKLISFVAALAALIAVVFSREIVVLLFSGQYASSSVAFGLLMIALHMTLITNIMSYTLTAAGYSGRSLAQDFARTSLNVAGDVLLIPALGFVGPPVATILSAYATNPLTVWLLRRSKVPVAVAPYLKQTALLVGFSAAYWLVQPTGILSKVVIVLSFLAASAFLSTISLDDLSLVLPKGLLKAPSLGQGAPHMATSISETTARPVHEKLRYEAIAGLLVTAIGAVLRLYHVSANSYNLDEVWSIWMAGQAPLDLVRSILIDHWDDTPPIFYLLLQEFMKFGQDPFFVRLLSVVAGTATVWITFKMAGSLFGGRVAILSSFLVAVAPIHIEFSQTARAYALADLWALCSLYFCMSILFARPTRWTWLGLVVTSALALYTFYVTCLVILAENALVLGLWLARGSNRSLLRSWLVSQAILAVVVLSTALSAFQSVAVVETGLGITWISRPGIQAIVKTMILFTTGDPSFGPSGVTVARILSLALASGLFLLVLWVFIQRGGHRLVDAEAYKVLFLVGTVLVPWATSFVISQVRPVYGEKYILFVLPPMLIVFAWAILRAPIQLPSIVATLVLLGLTGKSLVVYYSAPVGEQWREAISYMRPVIRPSDIVIIAPGYYMRPYAYYLYGSFPPDTRTIARSPAVVVKNAQFLPAKSADQAEADLNTATASGARVWYVSGYSPPDTKLNSWIDANFQAVNTGDFLGAHVQLLEPVHQAQARSGD